jgi:flagellar basal-body rod protein FlgG
MAAVRKTARTSAAPLPPANGGFMQNAMFSGVFAALTTEHRMAVISNNLANVNTTGYKADTMAFKDTMLFFAHDFIREPLENLRSKPLFPESQLRARTRIAAEKTDFSQGSMQYTGNTLDFAITGDGFFRIQTPLGDFLSRGGNFCQNADGTLVTKQGWPVLGAAGPIQIPAGTRGIHVTSDGRVFADDAEVGVFDITTVDRLDGLEKVGHNLYRLRAGSTAEELDPRPDGTMVNQGYTEAANVNAVTEMVNMIEVQRFFEAQQKVIQSADAVDREAITRVGRAR